jgi:hypothetical protein
VAIANDVHCTVCIGGARGSVIFIRLQIDKLCAELFPMFVTPYIAHHNNHSFPIIPEDGHCLLKSSLTIQFEYGEGITGEH